MGALLYGSTDTPIEFDDRTLSHLQVVICAKLRRGESFVFSFADLLTRGRRTLFLCDSIPMQFQYEAADAPALNRSWLEELSLLANSASGLRVIEEHRLAPLEATLEPATRRPAPVTSLA